MKIYKCETCRNVIELLDDKGNKIICCGKEMTQLIPENSEGAKEKHVPVVTKNNDEITVTIGSVKHPMDEDHYINWIALKYDNKTIRVTLKPNEEPEAKFPYIKGSTIYAYCDKHGLWKTIVE